LAAGAGAAVVSFVVPFVAPSVVAFVVSLVVVFFGGRARVLVSASA
jgi:hypothetical protein